MRSLLVLIIVVTLLPGCCLIGMTVAGSRAAADNDEVARKLERGEYAGPKERQVQSVGRAQLEGFVVGGLIDLAVAALAVSVYTPSWDFAPAKPSEY